METANVPQSSFHNIHKLKLQLLGEITLFNNIKQSGAFAELKEVHLRIKELEKQIELLGTDNI